MIADVHRGSEWARGVGGDCLPEHTLAEVVAKLEVLLARSPVGLSGLVAAGDQVASPRPCPRRARDVARLTEWPGGRGIYLEALRGNHDPLPRHSLRSTVVGGWTVSHGDRPVTAPRAVTGHLHPALRARGVNAPCFVHGPSWLLLPAFSPNAAGVSVAALGLERRDDLGELRCVAGDGGTLLDFGSLPGLLLALRD